MRVLLSTPFYMILADADSIQVEIPCREARADSLLQKIQQVLRRGQWHPPQQYEIQRKLKVLDALREHGTFSARLSRRLSDTYARKGDYLLCFFADFAALERPPFKEVWRVRLEHVPAFTEKVGKVYLILVRREVSKKVCQELRNAVGLYPIAEGEIFHFLLLHEAYHYVQSCFYQDLQGGEVERSVPFVIQEYNANLWAKGELGGFLCGERNESSWHTFGQ